MTRVLRVVHDHQIFDSQIHGGISRYHFELLARLHGRRDVSVRLAALLSNNAYLRHAPFRAPRPFFPAIRPLRKGKHITAINRWYARRVLRRGDLDVLHPTYYEPWFLDDLGGRPFVVTVHDMVHELFPEARVVRWDRDAAGRRGSHEEFLRRFVEHEADVMVGTQMIAKGLDLPLVTLVGVISADTSLHLPDYRAAERTFQLLTQVAGRAGRSPGRSRPTLTLLGMALDIGDGVSHLGDLLGFLVRDFHAELFLEGHDQLHRVQGVGPEILDERSLRLHFLRLDAQLIDDDLLDSFIQLHIPCHLLLCRS